MITFLPILVIISSDYLSDNENNAAGTPLFQTKICYLAPVTTIPQYKNFLFAGYYKKYESRMEVFYLDGGKEGSCIICWNTFFLSLENP